MKRRIPIVRRRAVLLALYEALRTHQRGGFANDRCIGVGALPTDLSAIYLEVERALEKA